MMSAKKQETRTRETQRQERDARETGRQKKDAKRMVEYEQMGRSLGKYFSKWSFFFFLSSSSRFAGFIQQPIAAS
jgi:hypothetical protein